jgi:hypothetical protein
VRRSLGWLGARKYELVLRLRPERLVGRLTRAVRLAHGRAAPEGGVTRAVGADAILQLLAIQSARPCSE